jgi:hypothetical protein
LDIEENIIIEAFPSLQYVSALQKYVLLLEVSTYTTGAGAAFERVCTTKVYAAPGGVSTTGT